MLKQKLSSIIQLLGEISQTQQKMLKCLERKSNIREAVRVVEQRGVPKVSDSDGSESDASLDEKNNYHHRPSTLTEEVESNNRHKKRKKYS